MDTDLDLIRQINRSTYPCLDGTSGSTATDREKREKQQMQDLLWSDPQVNSK